VKAGTIFDNIILTDSESEATTFREKTYVANKDAKKADEDEDEDDEEDDGKDEL